MRADQANSELDENTLFMTVIGGPSHGRALGFRSLLQKKVQTATTRERQNLATSCVSRLTEIGVQETFSRAEVQAIVQERDRRIEEEHAERIRDQAQNELMFSHILKMVGLPQPPTEFEGPTSKATQEVPSNLQMKFNQDVAGSVQPNQEGPSQALLNSQTAQEIAEERSQLANKTKALSRLKAKLLVIAEEQRASEIKQIREDVVKAEWGQQIRNYVFQSYKLVKDLRTSEETSNIAASVQVYNSS